MHALPDTPPLRGSLALLEIVTRETENNNIVIITIIRGKVQRDLFEILKAKKINAAISKILQKNSLPGLKWGIVAICFFLFLSRKKFLEFGQTAKHV